MLFRKNNKLEITIDKSHVMTIGARMYTESIELLRELINNAYDADATEVRVTIAPEQVRIQDNGSGMNEEGIQQYFHIGSQEKRVHNVSPRYHRHRIGEFGIGKFATLAACDRFEIDTHKDAFAARIVFDREDFERIKEWHIPIAMYAPTPNQPNGTTVTLTKMKKPFDMEEVFKRLPKKIPLRAKDFSVYINDQKLSITNVTGRHYPVRETTFYGEIMGDIVLTPTVQKNMETGVAGTGPVKSRDYPGKSV
jgi:HSP90 family molecular chaperone